MKTLLIIFLLSLPCFALAGEFNFDLKGFERELDKPAATSQLRIVRCTQGLAAVQESYSAIEWLDSRGLTGTARTEWRTLPAGCVPEEAAKRMYAEEVAWRNRPPAPSVLEPVEVIEP